jgi:uncharacterized membrane protein YkvA (DUF1232 family)
VSTAEDDKERLRFGSKGVRVGPRDPRSRWAGLLLIDFLSPDQPDKAGRRKGRSADPRMASRQQATTGKKRRRKGGFLKAIRWLAFVPLAGRIPMYARLVWALAVDARVPASRKAVLVLGGGYVLFGRDLIPDEFPLVGSLDDLAVVILAVELFLDGVPEDVLDEKIDELAIDREAFERDMDQVRRLTPAPVRRVIRRLPDALDAAGRLVDQTGIGRRVRSFI